MVRSDIKSICNHAFHNCAGSTGPPPIYLTCLKITLKTSVSFCQFFFVLCQCVNGWATDLSMKRTALENKPKQTYAHQGPVLRTWSNVNLVQGNLKQWVNLLMWGGNSRKQVYSLPGFVNSEQVIYILKGQPYFFGQENKARKSLLQTTHLCQLIRMLVNHQSEILPTPAVLLCKENETTRIFYQRGFTTFGDSSPRLNT